MRNLKRDLVIIDLEIEAARVRRERHKDEQSLRGNQITLDGLLDERFALSPSREYLLRDKK